MLTAPPTLPAVFYPGYARRQNLHIGNVEYYVGELIDGLHDKLTQQITRALRHEAEDRGQKGQNGDGRDFEAAAQQKTIAFLSRLPDLRLVLEKDVQAAY